MKQRLVHLQKGKRYLARRDVRMALHAFEQGLNNCSVADKRALAWTLFYLGITLYRAGNRTAALRSWAASNKLHKRGYARQLLRRFANEYGMLRQGCAEQDDWKAFHAIQLGRYLRSKRHGRITDYAEHDMINDLIFEYWRELKRKGVLSLKSPEEKLEIFRQVEIIFPTFVIPDLHDSAVIPVNFAQKRRVLDQDRCPCGSGRPYMACCGRTRGEDELTSGAF